MCGRADGTVAGRNGGDQRDADGRCHARPVDPSWLGTAALSSSIDLRERKPDLDQAEPLTSK